MEVNQPWIKNAKFDLSFIILPGIFSVILVLFLKNYNLLPSVMSPWGWLIVVVFIDVAHVWSTLFRTYLHKFASEEFKKELFLVPVFCWIVGTFIHLLWTEYFWTLMAYLAVFHFMRQQYGFLKIYSRQEKNEFLKKMESYFLYILTLYPVIHWHLVPKAFYWFREGDFITFEASWLDEVYFKLYLCAIGIYFAWIFFQAIYLKKFNLPKNLLLLNTGLVWYIGIVAIDNDWSFTLTNVINHGIPYLALIFYSSFAVDYTPKFKRILNPLTFLLKFKLFLFLTTVILLAYLEEFFWDYFVWHEHSQVFFYTSLFQPTELWISLIIGLLSVPQLTHYVLDGIIWRSDRRLEEFRF